MKRPSHGKLALHRETLASLSPDALHGVIGGNALPTTGQTGGPTKTTETTVSLIDGCRSRIPLQCITRDPGCPGGTHQR